MFGLGAGEILVILLMAVIFIGPKKLPELATNIGKALREFQKTKDAVMESLQNAEDGAGPEDDDKNLLSEDSSKTTVKETTDA